MSTSERLSALDAAFVKLDRMGAPYHVGAVLVFDRAPLLTPDRRLDVARLRDYIAATIDRLPRYRQRLGRVPILRHPVWVDEPHLDLDAHVRSITLAPPGNARQLDELTGKIFSLPLPDNGPPWQIWIVDGLEGNAFALISKVHHCLVDGVAGVHLLEEMLRGRPDPTMPARQPWSPEPRRGLRLLRTELVHRVRGLATLRQRLPGDPRKLVRALGTLLARGLRPASDAHINPFRVGHERSVARMSLPMADVLRIKRAHGVTINDVALAIVAGALRRTFVGRGLNLASLPDFRIMAPASTHAAGDTAVSGNHVALMLVRLPLDESDPARRLARVHEVTTELKAHADEVAAGELLVQLSDVTIPSILPAILGLSLAQRGFNLVVTNIPGPPFPLFLLGARLKSFHPVINLWPRQTFAFALMSYDGTLGILAQADRAAVPDLDALMQNLERSFAELQGLRDVSAASPWQAGTAHA